MQDIFDAIVVGGGIIGRLTAWAFGKSGKHTMLIEQNSINGSKSSSKGSSRMFGESFSSDVYFNLARQSRDLWRDLERETGEELLYLNGSLDISSGLNARRSVKQLASILRSRKSEFEILDSKNLRRRYPQWRSCLNTYAVYSPDGGILRSDRCMNAAIIAAQKHKVFIQDELQVKSIEPSSSGTVQVNLSSGAFYRTRKLILAAGPWMPNILRRLRVKLPLQASQEQTVYFSLLRNHELFRPENFPVWEREGREFIYGFPAYEKNGIKIAFHRDGRYLNNLGEFSHTPSPTVVNRLRKFLERYLPDAAGEAFGATTCLYTNTPDDDFVVDTVPGFPNVAYFTGDSGHAFHCAPALGKTLVELTCEGKTAIDISSFSAKRFKT